MVMIGFIRRPIKDSVKCGFFAKFVTAKSYNLSLGLFI